MLRSDGRLLSRQDTVWSHLKYHCTSGNYIPNMSSFFSQDSKTIQSPIPRLWFQGFLLIGCRAFKKGGCTSQPSGEMWRTWQSMTETICRIPLASTRIILLVLNLGRVAGWVAGGCWDYEIDSDELWIIPKNSAAFLRSRDQLWDEIPDGMEVWLRIFHGYHESPWWPSFGREVMAVVSPVLVFFFSQKSSNIRFFWDFRSGFSRFFWDRIHFVIASTRPLAVALLFCCSNPEVWQDRQVTWPKSKHFGHRKTATSLIHSWFIVDS